MKSSKFGVQQIQNKIRQFIRVIFHLQVNRYTNEMIDIYFFGIRHFKLMNPIK